MKIVLEKNIQSVSIPAISTGIFGYPVSKAALTIGNTIKGFIDSNYWKMKNMSIILCNFDDPTVSILIRF